MTDQANRKYRFHPNCLECGEKFDTDRPEAEFCSNACRKDWHNRRMQRGAEILDFIMSKRFDRAHEKEARLLIDRLASAYRDADKAKRGGRRSWRRFKTAEQCIPMAYGTNGDGR
jgi:predicted nucleic acid-binding Zn ribbon protein